MTTYTAKIATHWGPDETQITYESIVNEARTLTEDEIIQRCQECYTESKKWNRLMIHDPKLQDARDHMYGRWVADLDEMAAIWATV